MGMHDSLMDFNSEILRSDLSSYCLSVDEGELHFCLCCEIKEKGNLLDEYEKEIERYREVVDSIEGDEEYLEENPEQEYLKSMKDSLSKYEEAYEELLENVRGLRNMVMDETAHDVRKWTSRHLGEWE